MNTRIRITILYDNTLWKEGCVSDWGFSCLIEAHGKTILFDTGAKGDILLNNMDELNIAHSTIDSVFISHDHWDHVNGLSELLKIKNVTVFCPESCVVEDKTIDLQKIHHSCGLFENIFSTGELGEDEKEHALLIKHGDDITVIVGCSHPGVDIILEKAAGFGTVKNIIGGFHDFSNIETLYFLERICPTHCTVAIEEIRWLYPEKFIEGGVGRVITL